MARLEDLQQDFTALTQERKQQFFTKYWTRRDTELKISVKTKKKRSKSSSKKKSKKISVSESQLKELRKLGLI